ncbi:MAG: hypothetical protein WCO84_00890 [bacterium]
MKLTHIIKARQMQLKNDLDKELKQRGYKTINKDGFLYAKGNIPILLVAHLDTVHIQQVKEVFKSKNGNLWSALEGIGGDDRAGIYIILRLLEKFNCHVLFCEDEEIGCVGADKFVKSGIKPNVKYIVEYDRKGNNDAVFYECYDKTFIKFITDAGFKQNFGSYSDISSIAPYLQVSSVNLSAGYYNPHTKQEYINIQDINNIVEKSKKFLSKKVDKFKYEYKEKEEYTYPYFTFWKKRTDDLKAKYDNKESDYVDYLSYDNYEISYFDKTQLLDSEYVITSSGEIFEADVEELYYDFSEKFYIEKQDGLSAIDVVCCKDKYGNIKTDLWKDLPF